MKIKDKRNKIKEIELRDVLIGEVFEYDDRYYMNTDETNEEKNLILCVDLEEGIVSYFSPSTDVTLLSAKMVITN